VDCPAGGGCRLCRRLNIPERDLLSAPAEVDDCLEVDCDA
jgi:hypothetical protein